jgi:hypothetical protein
MYCPRCNQQQGSDDVSFCTRCGFQLGIVKELLANDGALPAHRKVFKLSESSPNQSGKRFGGKLIFFSIILLPLFLALSYTFDSPLPLWFPAVVFLAGLACVLYSVIFGEDILPAKRKAPTLLSATSTDTSALPTPSAVPVGELSATRINTAEMIRPPSVTEATTGLLRRAKD